MVQGEYFVLLPDGRLQTVKYTVGKYGGYVAHVRQVTTCATGFPIGPSLAKLFKLSLPIIGHFLAKS